MGLALRRRDEPAQAVEALGRWLAITGETGDRHGSSQALSNLGNAHLALGDLAAARSAHERAVEIDRELGHVRGLGIALVNLGCVHYELGDLERTRELNLEALPLHRQAGNRVAEALSLGNLAKLSHQLGQLPEAFAWGREALAVYRQMENRAGVREILHLLGQWVTEDGDASRMREYEALAMRALGDLGDPLAEAIATRQRGEG
jgi:tetratricopeptide (TPR) repeat protein